MVTVFVCVDDALRHGEPHLAEHLNHLPRMSTMFGRRGASAAEAMAGTPNAATMTTMHSFLNNRAPADAAAQAAASVANRTAFVFICFPFVLTLSVKKPPREC